MAAGCINSTLPAEVLERIFRLLPHRDRKVVVGLKTETTEQKKTQQVSVCRRGRDVGEQPGLLSWVMINVHLGNLARSFSCLEISDVGKHT